MAVHIEVDSKPLDISRLRSIIDSKGCGSIVSFVGLTRDFDGEAKVKGLEFDAWEDELPKVLRRISEEAISMFGVHSIVMSHRTGFVEPGQEIVCIHVGSAHRAEGFTACSWLISELKSQAPLWKKEIRDDGEFWKAGLG